MSTDPQPIIEYATPLPKKETDFLWQMMLWRSRCGWCLWFIIPGFFAFPLFAIAAIGIPAFSILTLIYMGKAAAAEVSVGYAARQVVLAVLLSPLFFLGVFLLPELVQSDLMKWRRVEERRRVEE